MIFDAGRKIPKQKAAHQLADDLSIHCLNPATLFRADRFNGTYIGTCSTVSTQLRINYIDISLAYCLYRTFINTGTACCTFIRNYVSHIFNFINSYCANLVANFFNAILKGKYF